MKDIIGIHHNNLGYLYTTIEPMPPRRVQKPYEDGDLTKSILEQALNNQRNEHVLYNAPDVIEQKKRDALIACGISGEKLEDFLKRLATYVYCESRSDFFQGKYYRWVDMKDPENIILKRGARVLRIVEKEGNTYMYCKSLKWFYHIPLRVKTFFRKLTKQEMFMFDIMKALHEDKVDEVVPGGVDTLLDILMGQDTPDEMSNAENTLDGGTDTAEYAHDTRIDDDFDDVFDSTDSYTS